MTLSMNDFKCPACGSPLQFAPNITVSAPIIPAAHVAGQPLPRREHVTTAVLCTGCEFALDMLDATGFPKPPDLLTQEIKAATKGGRA